MSRGGLLVIVLTAAHIISCSYQLSFLARPPVPSLDWHPILGTPLFTYPRKGPSQERDLSGSPSKAWGPGGPGAYTRATAVFSTNYYPDEKRAFSPLVLLPLDQDILLQLHVEREEVPPRGPDAYECDERFQHGHPSSASNLRSLLSFLKMEIISFLAAGLLATTALAAPAPVENGLIGCRRKGDSNCPEGFFFQPLSFNFSLGGICLKEEKTISTAAAAATAELAAPAPVDNVSFFTSGSSGDLSEWRWGVGADNHVLQRPDHDLPRESPLFQGIIGCGRKGDSECPAGTFCQLLSFNFPLGGICLNEKTIPFSEFIVTPPSLPYQTAPATAELAAAQVPVDNVSLFVLGSNDKPSGWGWGFGADDHVLGTKRGLTILAPANPDPAQGIIGCGRKGDSECPTGTFCQLLSVNFPLGGICLKEKTIPMKGLWTHCKSPLSQTVAATAELAARAPADNVSFLTQCRSNNV
ncbi:hypothetical protein BDK51DRAFT_45862 [Blyttiomyces helicus]|uniref:Uncharacterized protein n=1 Tax=Blyttiomyces helicus TaxID=388810 RepID=A0A4P9WKZ8_9FUNG|nr:hypothetical protein BDK51DRAFT_45862 [Blyttiomyces helicus]|eukprot:RKO91296.1 hypothetical protein BDK51DRAFT_45862 [Blyttiomyces helicus]